MNEGSMLGYADLPAAIGGGRKGCAAAAAAGAAAVLSLLAGADAADCPPDEEWGFAQASLARAPLTMQESSSLEAA
jgi:hypothetical protein